MGRREADLVLVVACSLALAIIIVVLPFAQPARVVLGLPFIFFFPGYTLTAALFPRHDDADPIERIALSLGLSITVVPLISLMLNYSPWGIRLDLVLVLVTLFIVLTATAGLILRRMLPVDEAFSVTVDIRLPRWSQVRLADRLLAVGMMLALVAVGLTAYITATSLRSSDSFTEFYVLGPGGKAEGYPSQLRVGETATVVLGIVSHEGQDTANRVTIMIDGETTNSIENLSLSDGDRWLEAVSLTPTHAGDNQKVEFLLYRDRESEPYRILHLLMTVKPLAPETIPLPIPDTQAGPVALSEAAPPVDEEPPPPEPTPPPPQPTPPPAEPPTVHIVVAGENLTRIARDYDLTLKALLAVNDIGNPNLIHPNQRINLPPLGGEGESQ